MVELIKNVLSSSPLTLQVKNVLGCMAIYFVNISVSTCKTVAGHGLLFPLLNHKNQV